MAKSKEYSNFVRDVLGEWKICRNEVSFLQVYILQ